MKAKTQLKAKEPTAKETGKQGGLKVLKEYGRKHFVELAKASHKKRAAAARKLKKNGRTGV